jgi:hypothetical protein
MNRSVKALALSLVVVGSGLTANEFGLLAECQKAQVTLNNFAQKMIALDSEFFAKLEKCNESEECLKTGLAGLNAFMSKLEASRLANEAAKETSESSDETADAKKALNGENEEVVVAQTEEGEAQPETSLDGVAA